MCNKCHKLGHFTEMCCTKLSSNPPSHSHRQQPPTQCGHHNQSGNLQQHIRSVEKESSDEDDPLVFIVGKQQQTFPVTINNTQIDMIIDSGATVNIIDEPTYKNITNPPPLKQTTTRIFSYQSDNPIDLLGHYTTNISCNNKTQNSKIYVVKGKWGSLLGKTSAEALDVLSVAPSPSTPENIANIQTNNNMPESTKAIVNEHSSILSGTGQLKNFQLKLHIDPSIPPVQQPIHRIPYHTKQKVPGKINRLLSLDIIKGPTTWLNPVVTAPKPNGKIRLCLDMRQANRAVIGERYIIPKIGDILTELHEATIFSKIDLKEGYHQIMLDEESRNITAFAVHEGIFRFKRLIYGMNNSFECFQKQIEQVISGIPNAKNISDDILIWGKAQEDHDSTLSNILKRIKDSGLKVNPSKYVFSVNKVTFGGHFLSKEGILLDPNKLSAIQDIQTPSSVTQVKSFLGMTNFCNRFIPNYSTITKPLQNLTRKDTILTWEPHHQEAFDTLKSLLTNATTMVQMTIRIN